MEDNMGFRRTTQFLNEHRTEEGRMSVGRSAVMAAFDRMEPKLDRVEKEVQGGASDAWEIARHNQMKQFLVMRGVITKQQLQEEYNGKLPDHYNPDLLPKLSRHQVIFFEEMHMNQEGGPIYNRNYQSVFPETSTDDIPHVPLPIRVQLTTLFGKNQVTNIHNKPAFV